jgi:hypothetical protein
MSAWTVTALDQPGSPSSPADATAQACSQNGSVIVGFANVSPTGLTACSWLKSDSSITLFATPLGMDQAQATACSDDGSTVVGVTYHNSPSSSAATKWVSGTPTLLDSNPSTSGYRLLLSGGATSISSQFNPGLPTSFHTGLFSWWIDGKTGPSFPSVIFARTPYDAVIATSIAIIQVAVQWTGGPPATAGTILVELYDVSPALIYTGTYDVPAYIIHSTSSTGMMLHLGVSFDTASNTIQVYLQREPLTAASETWSSTNPVGGTAGGFQFDLSTNTFGDLWFGSTPGLFDQSITSNLDKLIDVQCQPVDLGANGQNVTGSPPAIFLHCTTALADDFPFNYGTGGSWGFYAPPNVSFPPTNAATFHASVGAIFTGTGAGTNLTVTGVVGFISPDAFFGDTITGTGVPGGTTILSQTSGTTGGAGVYVTSNPTTSSGASISAASSVLHVTSVFPSGGVLAIGQTICGANNDVRLNTSIGSQIGGTPGGAGDYRLILPQQSPIANEEMFGLGTVTLSVGSTTTSGGALGCSGDGSKIVGFAGYAEPGLGIPDRSRNLPLPAWWNSGGAITVLDGWAGTKPGYGFGQVLAITQNGSIAVGFAADTSDPTTYTYRPVYWTLSDGHLHSLTSLTVGTDWDWATCVANNGTTIGGVEANNNGSGFSTPVLWTAGAPAALPGLPGNTDGFLGFITGVNGDASAASGYGDDSLGTQTALVWIGGVLTALPFLNNTDIAAQAFGISRNEFAGATFTGTGSGTSLTVTGVTGFIIADATTGDLITGIGVPNGTMVVSQTSGTTGGAGVYVTSLATTASGAFITAVPRVVIVGQSQQPDSTVTPVYWTMSLIPPPPGIPIGLNCGASTDTSITAEWAVNPVGGTPTSYTLRWRLEGTLPWTTITGITGTSQVITGLTPGLVYEWQVQAVR